MEFPDPHRNPDQELYTHTNKAEEQIRQLISRDKRQQRLKLHSEVSRDISHLRDQIKPYQKIPPLPLPTDLSNLRSIMQNSNSRGIQIAVSPTGVSHLTCTHKECIDRVVSTNSLRKPLSKSVSRKVFSGTSSPMLERLPLSDREPLGNPTGTQDIESLYEWFRMMKGQCENEEAIKVVYTMCARELLRQVSVHSSLRGKLLQEVIEMQPQVFGQQVEKLNNEFAKYKEDHEAILMRVEGRYEEDMKRRNLEIEELELKVRVLELDKKEQDEFAEGLKKSLEDLQKKYLETESLWKGRIISFMDEVHRKRKGGVEKRIPTLEMLKLKHKAMAGNDEDFKDMVESFSQIAEQSLGNEEDFMKFKDQLIKNNAEMAKIEENLMHKKSLRVVFVGVDECVQVNEEDFKVDTNEVNLNAGQESKVVLSETQGIVKEAQNSKENPQSLNKTENVEESPVDKNETINLNDYENKDFSVPLVAENSTASLNLFEDPDPRPEILIEHDAASIPKINEAPSYAEESKILSKAPEATYSTSFKRIPTKDQILQTEEILFQRYLDKLSQIDEIISTAKPEEVQQIQSSLQVLLQPDQSGSQTGQKVAFKFVKTRPGNEKLAAILEPLQRALLGASSDIGRQSSVKEVKSQVSELVNSIHFLSSAITEKQQDLMSIEKKIQQKSAILQVLTGKQVSRSKKTRQRGSEPFSDVPSMNKSKIKKKFTEGEFETTQWDEGYDVGYGDGKIQGFLKALEKIQETDLNDEIDVEETGINESKPLLKRKNMKTKIFTKFMEFNFHVPSRNRTKKIHPGPIILEKFLSRPLDRIKLRSTLSRKNLNRILSLLYTQAAQKLLNDPTTNLIIISYDEFYSKYGLKSVSDKKFLEFIASVVSNSEHKRCLMYMRLLRFGEIISSYSYSKYSLSLYLGCYSYISNSKLGFHFSSDEDDKIMVPLLRVTECIKEKLEFLNDKSILALILSKIEQKSQPDPKKINANGMVELELSLEIVLDTFEAYINSIWKGISLCLRAMGQQGKHTILSTDFYIISRFLNRPVKELPKDLIVEDMYQTCIKLNLASEVEVLKACPGLTKNELKNLFYSEKERVLEALAAIRGVEDKFLTYEFNVWGLRFEILENYLESDVFLASLAWMMYKLELQRVFPEAFNYN